MVEPWTKQGEMEVLAESYGRALVTQDFLKPNGDVVKWSFFYGISRGVSIVFALTVNNEVIAVRQYRGAVEKITDEAPGGNFNEGEGPLEAAERELIEEAHYRPKNLYLLAGGKKIMIDPDSYLGGGFYAVLATGCEEVPPEEYLAQDEDEETEMKIVPLQDWLRMIDEGTVDDNKSIAITLLALRKLNKI